MVLSFLKEIREKLRIEEIVRTQRFDRRIYTLKLSSQEKRERELIVEFTYYPFQPLQPFKKVRGLKIDSLFDIGVNKLFAISDRFDPKDFVDLYFLVKFFNKQTEILSSLL